MAKKDPVIDGTGVLKVKLGACLSGPTKRMLADLAEVAAELNRARNLMVRTWERWREDHPDWVPGTVKTKRGKDHKETPFISYDAHERMYELARERFGRVAGTLTSTARNEVIDRLKSRLPYDHAGASRFRWEGVLACEVARDCYRGQSIPVPNNSAVLCYEGDCSRDLSPGIMARVRQCGQSAAVLRFPLWSESAGRSVVDVICRLEVRQMSGGNREVLRKVARGEWKFKDSEVVCRDGKWFLHLTYQQPRQDLGLPKERPAVLELYPADALKPMKVSCAAEGDGRPFLWSLGKAATLEAEHRRLDVRRRVLRDRYRGAGANRGHGKAKFFAKLRPATREVGYTDRKFSEDLVSEAVKFCVRFRCGTLVYREPTMPLRQSSWFGARKINFDWTAFLTRLRHKCWLYGIELKVERMGTGEHRGKYGQARDG